jgi:hypothetical protein
LTIRYSSIKIILVTLFAVLSFTLATAQNDSTVISDTTRAVPVDSISIGIDTTLISQTFKPKPKDSVLVGVDSTNVYYFTGSVDSLKMGALHTIDTSTLYFHQYDPLFKYNGLYSTQSNIGLAQKNLVFSPTRSIGYFIQNQSFEKYIYQNAQVKYYHQYIPYTEAEYVIGPKKEQNFNIIFSRELFKRFTFGVNFALNNSPGSYNNSKADDKRVFFTSQWYTKNARYGVIANYLYNKLIVEENGGIKYDSVFEDNTISDRGVVPVNLTTATNTVKQSGFFVEQYFNLLKPDSDSIPRKIDAGNLSYSFNYQRNQMAYDDNAGYSSFYLGNEIPLDSTSTFDSVYQERIRNRVRWSSIGYHDDPLSQVFNIYFGATHDYIRQQLPNYADTSIQIQDLETSFSQLTAFGGIGINILKIFRLNAFAEYVVSENNKNDFKLVANLDQTLGSQQKNIGSIHGGIELITRSPSWYFQKFNSNYYRWSIDLKKENYMILFGEYRFRKVEAGVKFTTLGNYTYFNDSVYPMQLEKTATMLQIYFNGTIPVKKFGVNTRLVYQTTSAPNEIIIPTFSGTLDLFFKSPLFKQAAIVQTGFQFTYFSSFYALAYMPAIRDFYIQNQKKIGNYLYADVYLTIQIKQARLFIKYANLTSLFGNYDYYMAPNYPARDARFYFGVNWRFHD